MSRPLAPYFIGGLAGAAATIAAVFVLATLYSDYLPAWSAERQYHSVASADAATRCDAGMLAADAWALAADYDRAQQLRSEAETACAIDRLSHGDYR